MLFCRFNDRAQILTIYSAPFQDKVTVQNSVIIFSANFVGLLRNFDPPVFQ